MPDPIEVTTCTDWRLAEILEIVETIKNGLDHDDQAH